MGVPKIVDDYDMMSDSLFGQLFSKKSGETENLNENTAPKTETQENSFLSKYSASNFVKFMTQFIFAFIISY